MPPARGAPRDSIRPVRITGRIASLKWSRPEYVESLKTRMGPEVDYGREPAEDFASATVEYEDEEGRSLVGEATTSWSFVGAGLRLSAELLGPEYSLAWNTLDSPLRLFFSRAAWSERLVAVAVMVLAIVATRPVLHESIAGGMMGLMFYIYAIPIAISELAAGIVWLAIFTERGYLNTLLEALGVLERTYVWLHFAKPSQLLMAIVIAEVWRATSLIMIILVAGLQGIPRDYLEAADVFGANLFQRVWRVILPLLKPSLQVALILRTILAFQVFATVIVLGARGVTVLTRESYRWYDQFLNPHIAAAYASLILLLSLICTGVILWLLRTPKEQKMV
jgi:multiple sugar transport system permease protein